jgi:hypothetical protein
MRKLLLPFLGLVLLIACNNEKPADNKESTEAGSTATASNAPIAFADMKYADIAGKGIDALSAGNVESWMNDFADNAVYQWNNGDSLVGKNAIADYWKKRRTEVLDSINFTNRIFLPVNVYKPQSVEQPGIWVLSWYQTNAKYKTGKRMVQWIHTDLHFNANDKIDRVIQYLDRMPIAEAMKK